MKVGIVHIATAYTEDPAVFARKAEELGFESIWVGEHTVVPASFAARYPTSSDGSAPGFVAHVCDPIVTLMRAASSTSSIRLGTGVCLVPEHHLFTLTKQVATLDHYSGGRVILGAGVGWLQEEGEIAGNWPTRYQLLEEMVRAMKELWTKDIAEFQGELIRFPPVCSMPHPKQTPHPPVLIGGGSANLDRVVAYGDGWCPGFIPPQELQRSLDVLRERMKCCGPRLRLPRRLGHGRRRRAQRHSGAARAVRGSRGRARRAVRQSAWYARPVHRLSAGLSRRGRSLSRACRGSGRTLIRHPRQHRCELLAREPHDHG